VGICIIVLLSMRKRSGALHSDSS